MSKPSIALFVCLTMLPLFAASGKNRGWQDGKLTDISTEPYFVEGIQFDRITYTIDSGKYIYQAAHTHRRRDKALPLTVNGPIKFAMEKSVFYVLDDEGKEHELKFVKKTLKE
jgi:hypothetical protein